MWSLCRWVSTSAVSWLAVDPDRGRAHEHAASAVEQERGAAGADEGGRAGPVRVDERAAGAEQRDLDHRRVLTHLLPQCNRHRLGHAPSYRVAMLGKAHPALAVIAPPRLARFRERLGLGRRRSDRRRLHRLVEARAPDAARTPCCSPATTPRSSPCARDVAALRAVEPLGAALRPDRPRRDRGPGHLGLPGRGARPPARAAPRPAGRGHAASTSSATSSRELGRLAAGWHAVDPALGADAPPPVEPRRRVAAGRRAASSTARRGRRGRARPRAGPHARSGARARRPARGAAARRPRAAAPAHRHPRLADRSGRPPVRGVRPRRVGHGAVARPPRRPSASCGSARGTPTPPRAACPTTSAPVFEWHHACAHARKVLGIDAFPVEHGPDVVGTADGGTGRGAVRPRAPCRNSCVRKDVGGAMPAITVDDVLVLPRVPDPDPAAAVERRATSVTTAPAGLRGRGLPGAARLRRRVAGRPRPVHPHGRDGRGRVGARRRQGHVVAPAPRLRDRHLHARRHLPAPGLQRRRRASSATATPSG